MGSLLLATAAGAALLLAHPAHALDFSFSLTGEIIDSFVDTGASGTVTGLITGLADNATASATHVDIEAVPVGTTWPASLPYDITTDWTDDSFTVSDGQISSVWLLAQGLGPVFYTVSWSDGAYPNYEIDWSDGVDFMSVASDTITFAPVGIPEPAALVVLGSSLCGLGLIRRRPL